jgi:hypothetical protein
VATLVHSTYFHSVSGSTNPVVSLSAESTASNWILVYVIADFGQQWTLISDQGESFSPVGITSGSAPFNAVFWLLESTKTCSSITFTSTHGGSNNLYYAGIFEVSGTGLQYVNQGGVNGGGSHSTHAFETSHFSTSVQLAAMAGSGTGTTMYFSGCAGGAAFPPASFSVTGGWTLDQLTVLSDYQVASGYLSSSGTQQPTYSWTAASAQLDAAGIYIQDSVTTVATTTTVVSNDDPSFVGASVTFTATVNGPGGTGSPTGTVTFNIDGSNVATVAVSAVSTGVSQAQYSTSSLSLGIHPVQASYSGDSQYLASTSSPIDQIVVQQCPFPFGTALQELANRLYDSTMQFWSPAELVYYMQEAFRTWNALTSYWRGDFTFPTQQGVVFYDITNATAAPNTIRPHTITDQYLYNIIEYHLLEPVVGAGPWTGSLQFDIDDILNAVQRRDNEILGVTGCSVTHFTTVAAPDRIYLPNTTLEIRRVAYVPGSGEGSTVPMFQDDTWGIGAYQPSYTTQPPGTPSTYRISTEPVLSFDADVPPLPGQYDLVTIQAGPQLVTTQASTFTIPDDWTWVLKWGALADLLGKESNAKDLLRAKYAEGRYKQGLALLSAASAVLAIRANNAPLQIDALKSADLYNPTWQGQAQGPPTEAMTAGLNLIAIPPPDAGPYSLTATVVENAPVPILVSDCLQVTQDVFDVILDYAQHLAMFKCGGEEFLATQPLLQRFMQLAALYSSKLAEQGEFTKILYAISQDEANMNPRYTPDSDPAAAGDQ